MAKPKTEQSDYYISSDQRTIIPQSRKSRWVKRFWYTIPDNEGANGLHDTMVGDGEFVPNWKTYVE